MTRKYQIVEVVWEDITSHSRWTPIDSKDFTTMEVHSVGYILPSCNKKYLILSPMLDKEHKSSSDTQVIPKGVIKSIRKLDVKA